MKDLKILNKIFSKLTPLFQPLSNTGLISVYAYEIPDRESDLNTLGFSLLFIFESLDTQLLNSFKSITKLVKKYPVKFTVFTKNELENALDVFPIEFLDMLHNRHLIMGIDLLETMRVTPTYLRHECEFYLRSHILKLRHGFIQGKIPAKELILHSFQPCLTIFKYLLKLKNNEIPNTNKDLVAKAAQEFNFSPNVFFQIIENIGSKDLGSYFHDYLTQLAVITAHVDQLQL
ncbi:hypothetical protein ACFL96_01180 [Thermoproteota archaeon]